MFSDGVVELVEAGVIDNSMKNLHPGRMVATFAADISKGGRSTIAMPSTTSNGKISKIVPYLDQGAAVTTSRNDVEYVVTEYGVANLRYHTVRDRAKALIGISHPKFRDELWDAFEKRFNAKAERQSG